MGIFEYAVPQLHDAVFSPTAIYFNTNTGTEDSSGNVRTLTQDQVFTSLSSSEPYVSPIRSFSGGRYSITSSDFRSVGALTITCMMKLTGSRTELVGNAQNSFICGFGGPAGDTDSTKNIVYQYYLNSTNRLVLIREYGSGLTETNTGNYTFPLDEWFHFCVRRSSDSLSENIFINGRAINTETSTNAPTGGTNVDCCFVLGQGFLSNETNYHQMSSFTIWIGTELSSAQIQYLARRCLGK